MPTYFNIVLKVITSVGDGFVFWFFFVLNNSYGSVSKKKNETLGLVPVWLLRKKFRF
jgi:hypothetical protein